MDFQAEYKDFFEGLGDCAAFTYKFFDLFHVYLGTGDGVKGLHWGKDASDTTLSEEQLKELKSYLKQAKGWIRKEQRNASQAECRRRMVFFVQKLLEFGAFARGERREIIAWMDNLNFLVGVKLDTSDEV